jgi:phosphoribosylamine--glycine ligase
MKILIIGSGGREHAIAHAVSKSSLVSRIVVCPGNPGMSSAMPGLECKNISATDIEALTSFALGEKFDLTIVGPESTLSLGIVDLFQKNNLAVVGPTKAASTLESSKAFAKKIMEKAGVPTAGYAEFFEVESALAYIEKHSENEMVVKCDGLAQGKGVIVCVTKEEAKNAVRALMLDKFLGENINHIIIEDFLDGIEVSAFALCDGKTFSFLGTACDHKRLSDGDLGPNTGGMGTFSPARCFDQVDQSWMEEKVFSPMMAAMKDEGIPFSGILFAGLMKTKKNGWQVLEFNVRFGDPETQVLLPLIEDDLVPLFMAAASGELKSHKAPQRKNLHGVHVVMAAHGYPGTEGIKVRSGDEIHFEKDFRLNNDEILYFAGVDMKDNKFITKGGRVLGLTAIAETPAAARTKAYEKIEMIHFDGAQFRHDIGAREV